MTSKDFAVRCSRLIRTIVIANFLVLVADSSSLAIYEKLRHAHAVNAVLYVAGWLIVSTVALVILMTLEITPKLRERQETTGEKRSTLIDRRIVLDASLAVVWVLILLISSARAIAGVA